MWHGGLPADGLLDELHPLLPVILGGGVQLVHLRGGGVTDQEHPALLIGYVPHNEILQRHHGGLVLGGGEKRGREREMRKGGLAGDSICRTGRG